MSQKLGWSWSFGVQQSKKFFKLFERNDVVFIVELFFQGLTPLYFILDTHYLKYSKKLIWFGLRSLWFLKGMSWSLAALKDVPTINRFSRSKKKKIQI